MIHGAGNVGHVVTNVGGVYEDLKKPNQKGSVYRGKYQITATRSYTMVTK
jgi:hypothetical protein